MLTIAFGLNGQPFVPLNGNPVYRFTEAVSFMVNCRDREETDYSRERVTADGDGKAQVCGWLRDRSGLSWQVCRLN